MNRERPIGGERCGLRRGERGPSRKEGRGGHFKRGEWSQIGWEGRFPSGAAGKITVQET